MNRSLKYVLDHPLNRSKTKEAHVFSKADRFGKPQGSPCLQYSYDLTKSAVFCTTTSRMSSARFPRQKRFQAQEIQIKRRSLSPSPNYYHTPDFIESSKREKKGSAFSRQQRMNNVTKAQIPGPGAYEASRYNPQTSLSYSMRNKPKKDETHWNKVGPGQYKQNTTIDKANRNVKIGTQKRFKNISEGTPAPGAYHIERMATEPTTKFESTAKFSFGKSKRGAKKLSEAPGPGAYHQFSQFSQRSQRIMERLKRL